MLSGFECDAGDVAIRVEGDYDSPDLRGYLSLSFEDDVREQAYIRQREGSVFMKRDNASSYVGSGNGHAVGRVGEALLQREGVDLESGIQ